jgi:predicted TIM-barrel fold metal-dependent hydrolase
MRIEDKKRASVTPSGSSSAVRPFVHGEKAIEPELCIVDPHHHVWDDLTNPLATHYPTERLMADVRGGHNVVGTVYAECSSHYRVNGPDELKPVGETEWVVSQDLLPGIMEGIVGYADVRTGAMVREVLEAHRAAAGDRFKGVRYSTAWDASREVPNTAREAPPGTLLTDAFVRGVQEVGNADMVFDTWMYFHQLPELAELARAAPQTTIVLDHLGGPLGIGPYERDRESMLSRWRTGIAAVAAVENTVLKIGGLGFPYFLSKDIVGGLPDSDRIAAYWRPEVQFCIESFGVDRCMFESNFPVDSYLCDYVTLWNAFKKISRDYSPTERHALFAGTAASVYNLTFG